MGRLRGWFVGAPRWLFTGLVVVNALLTLAMLAVPGGYFALWLVSGAGWLVLGLFFAVRLGLLLAIGSGWRGLRESWLRWGVVPLIVASHRRRRLGWRSAADRAVPG